MTYLLQRRCHHEDPEKGGEAYSYVAIADGERRKNLARVYAGWYGDDVSTRVPLILVVKVGTEAEQNGKKPGNRGKRDSQVSPHRMTYL